MLLTLHLLGFWALAFVTLAAAIVLLNIFDNIIGNDLTLHSVGKEAMIAGFASLIEGASVWAVVSFLPAASRALIIPALVVGLIYKISHFEDWSRYDIFMLLAFQSALALVGGMLFAGKFGAAVVTLAVFAGLLVIVGSVLKEL